MLYSYGQPVFLGIQGCPSSGSTPASRVRCANYRLFAKEWHDPTVKLLIVDDSSEIRRALRRIAEQQHHVVIAEAENGKEALRLFPEAQPDMVLLDVSMPVLGGFATARELRQIAPEVPIMFISQHAGDDYVTEAFRLGARGYLLKS